LFVDENTCRLAFHGEMLPQIQKEYTADYLSKHLMVCKTKEKVAQVEKVVDDYTILAKNLFQKKVTNDYLATFIGKKMVLINRDATFNGVMESTFGKSGGKFRVRFSQPIPKQLDPTAQVKLVYKINIFDKERKWIQEWNKKKLHENFFLRKKNQKFTQV